jgi:hypothetical protein
MISTNRLYREILSKFNFSIVGYGSIYEIVDDFFESMVNSSVLYEKKHLDFVSYAYAILKNIDPFELDTSIKSEFFFNTFKERSFELFILHEFYAFKNHVLSKCKGLANSSTTSLKSAELSSELFRFPTPFRVITTDEEYTTVKYDQHRDVLTFEIPVTTIFKGKKQDETVLQFTEIHKRKVYRKFEEAIKQGSYSLLVKKENNIYTVQKSESITFYNEDFVCENLEELVSIVASKFKLLNQTKEYFFFNDNLNDTTLNEWVMFVLSHAFLSYFLNGWIENIPSIIKDEGNNAEKRCLGVMIIGYEKENEISDDERAMLRIIADKVSSGISTQNLLNNHLENKLRQTYHDKTNLRKDFIETCKALDEKTSLKALNINPSNTKTDKLHGRLQVEYSDKNSILNIIDYKTFGHSFKEKINECFKQDIFNKNCLIRIRKDDEKRNQHNVKLPNYTFYKVNEDENLLLKLMDSQSSNIDFVNLALIEDVLNVFDGIGNYSFSWNKTNRYLDIGGSKPFDLANFNKRFIEERTGSIFNKVIKELSTPLIAQGNFIILCCETTEIFNLEKYLENKDYLKSRPAQCDCQNFTLRFQLTQTN